MQVSWPRPACTHTRAPPSPPCPVASLTRGIVVRVPSKSFSAARKNRLNFTTCSPASCHCARQRLHTVLASVFICTMAGDALPGKSAPSGSLALSPSTHSSQARNATRPARVWPPYCSLMQVSWPRLACTNTRAPHRRLAPSRPSPAEWSSECPRSHSPPPARTASSKASHTARAHSLVAARPRRRAAAAPGLPRPPSCAPAHTPPSSHRQLQWPSASCACTSAMHLRDRPGGYGGRRRHRSHPPRLLSLTREEADVAATGSHNVPDPQAVDQPR